MRQEIFLDQDRLKPLEKRIGAKSSARHKRAGLKLPVASRSFWLTGSPLFSDLILILKKMQQMPRSAGSVTRTMQPNIKTFGSKLNKHRLQHNTQPSRRYCSSARRWETHLCFCAGVSAAKPELEKKLHGGWRALTARK